jgi:hypothetical protein
MDRLETGNLEIMDYMVEKALLLIMGINLEYM